jgi:hypothetical protein
MHWVVVLVRVTLALGIAYLTAFIATAIRDDAVGLAAGVVFGLAFGFLFVHVDFARLRHGDGLDDPNR